MFLGLLAVSYRRYVPSDLSYLLIFLFLCLHEWGAQHKYTVVPLGEWMKAWLGTRRNHYDRVIHFSYGFFLAYPMQEWFQRVVGVQNRWRYLLPVEMVLAFSAIYEIAEACMAILLTPERGEEFVGMQGDFWDAQKDMALAGLGATCMMLLVAVARSRFRRPGPGQQIRGKAASA